MEEKKEIMLVDEQTLRDKVYTIRGQKVMLDFDLAEIYGYTTKRFNEQIKRNSNKFEDDFLFRLTTTEISALSSRSQNATLNVAGNNRGSNIKYLPYAFTEQGIYMLMTVLRGPLAVEQSKNLIRLFKSMKDYLTENDALISARGYTALLERVANHEDDIREIKDGMADLQENMVDIKESTVSHADLSDFMKLFDDAKQQEEILILDGQPFKADLAYQKIYRRAKRKIVIIDDYINSKTLQHLAHAKPTVKVTIVSDNKGGKPLRFSEYQDFLTEYPGRSITLVRSMNKAHDRYIILDHNTKDMKVYHCGTSSKDAGRRITTITQLKDTDPYREMVKDLFANPQLLLK